MVVCGSGVAVVVVIEIDEGGEVDDVVFERILSLVVRERVLGLLVNVIVSVRSFDLTVC